jgi:rhomboid protease GluP
MSQGSTLGSIRSEPSIRLPISSRHYFVRATECENAEHNATIEFHPHHVSIPRRRDIWRNDSIQFSKIHSVVRIEWRSIECVIVGATRSFPIAIRSTDMEDPASLDRFAVELKHRISIAPDGRQNLQGVERREVLFHRLFKPPPFIFALVGLLALLHWQVNSLGVSLLFVPLPHPGSFTGDIVVSGEFYRLVTANFLHADLRHLVTNSLGLIVFGWFVEAAMGAKRISLLLFASSISAFSLTALVFNSTEQLRSFSSIGASNGVWALIGASLVISTQNRTALPAGFRVQIGMWVVIALTLHRELVHLREASLSHLGGGMFGLIFTAAMTYGKRTLPPFDAPWLSRAVAFAALTSIVSGGLALRNYWLLDYRQYLEVHHDETGAAAEVSDRSRNDYARHVAMDRAATDESLSDAISMMEMVLSFETKPDYLNILAILHYRSRNFRNSVELMQTAWHINPNQRSGAHLAPLPGCRGDPCTRR